MKSVIANSEDEARKNTSLAIKRIIAAIILFLIPTIVNITMTTLESVGVQGAKYYQLATSENVNSKIFKEWEAAGSAGNNQINSLTSSRSLKVVPNGSAKTTNSINTLFKLKKDFIVLANIKNNSKAKEYQLVQSNIEILDNQNNGLPVTDFTFASENPGIAVVSANGIVTANFGGTTNIIVASKSNPSSISKLQVTVVHSLYTKVKTTKKITATNLKTGQSITLPKGTKGIYNGLAEKNLHRNYTTGNTLKVGNDYYKVDVDNVKHYGYYVDQKLNQKTVEEFVNSHGFSSKTKYLFWSNQGTEYEYIFNGSKGNWKLLKVFPISSGDALGYKIGSNSHGNSGTGIYPDMYVMGSSIHKSFGGTSYPDGYIPKNDCCSGYHAYGGTRKPRTHGCTSFKKSDLNWFTKNLSKIKKSQIVTI